MVPLHLALRNFMCYRGPTELDLAGLRLACLCGDNGNGKSALLDAITWALWGKARSSSDDGLVHMAESDMEVDLEFLAGDQRYRVVRRHARSRRSAASGHTSVDLFQPSTDGWKAITGDSVRQTERRVSELLGLDYATFINSAFLVQGRADEFTVKPPGKRKEVLADILGLAYYDQAATRARELARQREGQREALEGDLRRIEAELVHLPEHQSALGIQEGLLAEAGARLKGAQAQLQELEAAHHRLEAQRAQLQEAAKVHQQASERLTFWQTDLARRMKALQDKEAVLAQAAAIRQGYVQWQQAVAIEEVHAQKLTRALSLGEEHARLDRAIAAARQGLEGHKKQLEAQMALWRPQAQALLGFERQRDEVQARLKALAQSETELERKAKDVEAAREREQAIALRQKQLAQGVEETREKAQLMSQGEGRCPLCGSALAREETDRLRSQFGAQVQEKTAEMQRLEQDRLRQHRELQALQEQSTKEHQRVSRERATMEGRLQAVGGDISRARRDSGLMAQASPQLQTIERKLASGDLLPEEQARLKVVMAEESQLAYDPAEHQAAREERDRLKAYPELHQRLGEAQGSLEADRQAADTAKLEVDHWHEAVARATERQRSLETGLAELPGVLARLAEARQQVEAIAKDQARVQGEVGAARQRLEACLSLRQERESRLVALDKASEEKSLYDELSEAFGRNGIQALIIETTLPELEVEANRLLGRMSDNRLRVALETQRQARSRHADAIETLDINISDEWGTRSYELYSGGEAFRINFALRIALSKLLARRAGAPLPTLFIDEGFGTQDTEGRGKLVDAIRSIQDDFQLILVITHMEDMKEAFPVRIEVTKTEAGSSISVS